ncbi:MAG: hypothetical protein ACRDLO_06245 [Solirubrobacterales bacterium]
MGSLRSLASLAALIGLVVALAPPGAIGDDRPKSQVKIQTLKLTGASGVVRSKDDRCERGRRIHFFRLEDFISVKVQRTRTDSNGRWRIARDLDPGGYFAKVERAPGCRYDNSRIERLR